MVRTYRKVGSIKESTIKEKNFLPSETVPDEAMTIRQIMEKFVNNTLGDIQHDYDYSDDLIDVRFMDVTEKDNLLASLKQEVNEKTDIVRNSAKEQREIKAKAKEMLKIERDGSVRQPQESPKPDGDERS